MPEEHNIFIFCITIGPFRKMN